MPLLTIDQAKEHTSQAIEDLFSQKIIGIKEAKQAGRHKNYFITLKSGIQVVARFQKSGSKVRVDPIFGSNSTIQREHHLLKLLEHTPIPSPQVYSLCEKNNKPFLLVEKLEGTSLDKLLKENNYSASLYLNFVKSLGETIATLQQKKFNLYGEVQKSGITSPNGQGTNNYLDWLSQIIKIRTLPRIDELKSRLSDNQLTQVVEYFNQELVGIQEDSNSKPTCVLYDLHVNNFLVNQKGIITGMPDIEFMQAAHPSLEISYLYLQSLSYFTNETWHQKAQETFFESFNKEGEHYDPNNQTIKRLENLANMNRLLTAVLSYNDRSPNHLDWHELYTKTFCNSLINTVETGILDRLGFVEPIRNKNGRPKEPQSA